MIRAEEILAASVPFRYSTDGLAPPVKGPHVCRTPGCSNDRYTSPDGREHSNCRECRTRHAVEWRRQRAKGLG